MSNETLRVDEPEDIGKKLDDRWASQLDIWKKCAYYGAATKGVDSLKDVGKVLKNPTLGSAATFLQDAGTIAGLLPFPPESQVIGIGLYAIGGIMSVFDSTPAEPSNSDVIASITSAFDSPSKEIHVVEKQVDVAIAAVAHLQATVDVLAESIQALYKDIHLRYLQMGKIDSVYVASMEQLQYAQNAQTKPEKCRSYMASSGCGWTHKYNCPGQTGSDSMAGDDGSMGYECCCTEGLWNSTYSRRIEDSVMEDFKKYVKTQRTNLADEVYNSMAPSNIKQSLSNSLNNGGNCVAELTFKWHMATRWKLYWIMVMGSFFANGVSPQIEGYSKQLKADLTNYMVIAAKLQISGLVKLQDTDLSKCLDMPHRGDYNGLRSSNMFFFCH